MGFQRVGVPLIGSAEGIAGMDVIGAALAVVLVLLVVVLVKDAHR